MKTINIDLKNINKKDIDFIIEEFLREKVIVYPTDTVYGIGCIASSERAINKIKIIKKRDKNKPFIFLVRSFCMAKKYAKINKKQNEYLRHLWPSKKSSGDDLLKYEENPSTAILCSRGLLAKSVDSNTSSIALRLPKNDFLSTILRRLDLPIVSTSLNLSGQKTIEDLKDLKSIFKGSKPDLVINAGKLKTKNPSSIIDIRDINNIIKLR